MQASMRRPSARRPRLLVKAVCELVPLGFSFCGTAFFFTMCLNIVEITACSLPCVIKFHKVQHFPHCVLSNLKIYSYFHSPCVIHPINYGIYLHYVSSISMNYRIFSLCVIKS